MKVKAAPSANATAGAHYRSNLELEAALKNFTQRCSHISRLYRYASLLLKDNRMDFLNDLRVQF